MDKPPSRSESSDQGKRRVDKVYTEEQRIKEALCNTRIKMKTIQQEMYQSIAATNRACQAAKERVQAEREFALRDLETQMNVTKQRIAGMRTEMDQCQSQTPTHFQQNFTSQTSCFSRRQTSPDTPFTSSSLFPLHHDQLTATQTTNNTIFAKCQSDSFINSTNTSTIIR